MCFLFKNCSPTFKQIFQIPIILISNLLNNNNNNNNTYDKRLSIEDSRRFRTVRIYWGKYRICIKCILFFLQMPFELFERIILKHWKLQTSKVALANFYIM